MCKYVHIARWTINFEVTGKRNWQCAQLLVPISFLSQRYCLLFFRRNHNFKIENVQTIAGICGNQMTPVKCVCCDKQLHYTRFSFHLAKHGDNWNGSLFKIKSTNWSACRTNKKRHRSLSFQTGKKIELANEFWWGKNNRRSNEEELFTKPNKIELKRQQLLHYPIIETKKYA